ncbi:MAG: TonB-dependent receptor plug domain-containing protein, partial [Myxococcota bacterium]
LEGVLVIVDGTDITGNTDGDGRFALRGVPPGKARLRLLNIGHVETDQTLDIIDGAVTTATLYMRQDRAGADYELTVTGERERTEVTRRTISIEEVKRIPGTFGDPLKVIQTLPGAARTPFGTGFLVIRGADPEDSGVYVDGIRVPLIYHLTGTTSILSPELFDSVDYLPGGYGVKYGRTMGGTINVNTKSEFSETGKLVFGADVLDAQVYYEGRLGKNQQHGFAAAARRSYIDAFLPAFLSNTDFQIRPRYWDYQVKWVPELPGDRSLSLFVYGSEDLLSIRTPDDFAQGSDQDTQGDLSVSYGSQRLIAIYKDQLTEDLEFEFVPSVGVDFTNTGLGQAFRIENTNILPQIRAQFAYEPFPELEAIVGIDVLGGRYRFDFRSAVSFEAADDPLAEREPIGFDGTGSIFSPDPFVRLNLRPIKGSDRWLLSPGLRLNYVRFTADGSITGDGERAVTAYSSLDPRILTRVQVVPDRFALKAATGIYHQPPQPQEAIGLGTASTVQFEQSWSTTFGWEQRLTNAITYDVDLFYRQMSDLVVFDESFTGAGQNPFINGGDGRAYGFELMARHDPVGRFFGWISYTLSRATRRDPFECVDDGSGPENRLLGTGPCWFPFDFDQTHIFSAQAGYDLPNDWGISMQVQYVTGNPTSLFNAGVYDADTDTYTGFRVGQVNADRVPPFFQTSLRVDKLWTFRKWQLNTYVDLLNTVRGVNPEFTLYNYDFTEFAYVRGLPFIPNIGIEARLFP